MSEPLTILPPPGPLSWLFPELLPALAATRDSGRVLDLCRCPWRGRELARELRRQGATHVRVQGGPRGETLALVLRRWVAGSVTIETGAVEPPSLEDVVQSGAGESLLIEPDGKVASLPLDQATAECARARGGVWLAPMTPDLCGVSALMQRIVTSARVFRDAGLVPCFRTAAPVLEHRAVTTRLPLSYWGLLPGDGYEADLRLAMRDLIARLYPERAAHFALLEHYALCGIDLFADALAGRWRETTRQRTAPARPLIVAVCGTDGSGKSTHVDTLTAFLQQRGVAVAKHKIYRHGLFHDTVTDLSRRCAGEQRLHLWRLERLIKVFDSLKYYYRFVEPDLRSRDALVFDRYTFTHEAASLGRLHHDPFARELLQVFPPAHLTFLLDAPIEQVMDRIGARDHRTIDENPYMLERYREAFSILAERCALVTLDATAPVAVNRGLIQDRVAALLPPALHRQARPRPGEPTPAPASAAVARCTESLAIVIDPGPDRARGMMPLIADDSEYLAAVAGLARDLDWRRLPEEVFYHWYAYECVERMRELKRAGTPLPTVVMPLCPEALFAAAGIRVHAAEDLLGLLDGRIEWRWRPRPPHVAEAAARRFLGRCRFDARAYCQCLATRAGQKQWSDA
ncbi:MAG: hypothetical protein U1E76_13100 [Planctomycetota bacterium]